MTKIFISGAGAFGVALALSLEKTQKNITLITRDPKTLSRTRKTTKLPGVIIPQSINISLFPSSINKHLATTSIILFLSAGFVFDQIDFGTTPNIAPPSSLKPPVFNAYNFMLFVIKKCS